jgi:hypothetical protein
MTMDTNLVVGLSTALGAAIGGLFTLLSARRQEHVATLERERDKLLKDYVDACRNIESFHKIEEAYSKELSGVVSRHEHQVKVEMRDRVEKAGGGRPTWSARDARKAIDEAGI